MSESVFASINSQLTAFGLAPTPSQLTRAATYFGLLTKWNKTVNLTALELEKPSQEAIDRLLVEPFLAAKIVQHELGGAASKLRVLDVGSGGGSPAVPLAIALGPGVHLSMVESRGRKAAFLREVVRQLPLERGEVFSERLDTLEVQKELREAFDLVSIRAVRADQALWKSLASFVRPGGLVLWFRSAGDDADSVFFPHFLLHAVEPLRTGRGSELATLRRPV